MDRPKHRQIFVIISAIFLALLCTGCAVAGILINTPVIVPPSFTISNPSFSNVWNIQQNGQGTIIMGGTFNIGIALQNLSRNGMYFSSESLKFYYYPIGSSVECLLLNGGHISQKTLEKQPVLQYRIRLNPSAAIANATHTNWGLPKTQKVWVPARAAAADSLFSFTWSVGFQVPASTIEKMSWLYNDCKKHNFLIFSVSLGNNKSISQFTQKEIPFDLESILIFKCNVVLGDNNVFTRTTPVWSNTLFDGLLNEPNLINS